MATNSVPAPKLGMTIDKTPDITVVRCTGRIVSDTTELLKKTVKPLFEESKTVVLDFTDVNHIDSSGLGTIVGLYISASSASCQLKMVNLSQRVKELFSMTRLNEVLDPLCTDRPWGF
jgi:anti-sigma B factor antagonist